MKYHNIEVQQLEETITELKISLKQEKVVNTFLHSVLVAVTVERTAIQVGSKLSAARVLAPSQRTAGQRTAGQRVWHVRCYVLHYIHHMSRDGFLYISSYLNASRQA